jgi:membrane-bound serine protease (ClpP class)
VPISHRSALRLLVAAALVGFAALLLAAPVHAQVSQPVAGPLYTVQVEGTISSATTGYLRRALQLAEASNASALVITLASSGGVLRDIRPFAGEIAEADVPVIVYIAPAGTQAGAAGAFLASAAHISAMAPGTSFGSAYPLTQVDEALSQQTRDMLLDSVADQIGEWNASRGRDVTWVERAVREGAILTNEQAAASAPPAVDFVAANQDELLTLLEGRQVALASGAMVMIAALGQRPAPLAPTLFENLLLTLADPTVAFALLVLGAMAIYLELASPGVGAFVGIGLVLLLGAGVGLVALPVRWWAVGLLALALLLIGAEFVVHSHGGLTVAGLTLLVIGALTLIDPIQAPGVGVANWAIATTAGGIAGTVGLGVAMALRSRSRPAALGQSALIGRVAEVRQRLDPRGMVFVEGALWQAVSEEGIAEPGDWVRVIAVHRLNLIVRPLDVEADSALSVER